MPVRPALRSFAIGLLHERVAWPIGTQIRPGRVLCFNEGDLPRPVPPLELPFTRNSRLDVGGRLIIGKLDEAVLARVAGDSVGTMLKQAPLEVVGDADVEQ